VFTEFCADPVLCEVVVKARGVFTWIETGKEWEEVFVWRLGMRRDFSGDQVHVSSSGGGDNNDGSTGLVTKDQTMGERDWKVWRWQVWADTASLMLAKKAKEMDNIERKE